MSRTDDPGKSGLKLRLMALGALMFLVFLMYAFRLFNLQVVENLFWEGRAKAVSQRSQPLIAQRGLIWDRNVDEPLATNIDSFAVHVTPAEIGSSSPEEVSGKLALVLNMDAAGILGKLPEHWQSSWNPIEIKEGVPYETVIEIAEESESYPGVGWSSKPYRWYNRNGAISHILGYVGNITVEELQLLYNKGYANTASLGKSGVEKTYDGILRGTDGKTFRTVDVRGRDQGDDDEVIPPENGLDIVLTIDRHIQDLAEKALGPRKGAVVVLKPNTGEILALVSYPSFNPNVFGENGPGNFGRLSLNTDFPFLNRTIHSGYAPASTFKPIMTAAILGEDAVDPNMKITCRGFMQLGNREFRCWKRSGHGPLNLSEALENSCNIYFGKVGVEELGIDVISEYARAFGLGLPTGIPLDGEQAGIVPGKSWKGRLYNTPWTGGDTLNASVGQGFLSVTPLQMANVLSAIANGGSIYRPRLLKEVRRNRNGTVVERTEPELLRTVDLLTEDDWNYLRRAMRRVITQGTGEYVVYTRAVDIAGKTGTGEVGLEDSWHDWFVAYGPYETDDPDERIVVVAMAEAAENYDYWAPKATDIIFEGVFNNLTYREVVESWRQRRIWWSWDTLDLPQPGYPFSRESTEDQE